MGSRTATGLATDPGGEVTRHYHRLRESFLQKENNIGFVTLLFAIGFVVLFLLMLLYSDFSG
jgi:hypothetical protein